MNKADLCRADSIALAATRAEFSQWCEGRVTELVEEFCELQAELTTEIGCVLERCPHFFSEEEKNAHRKRKEEIERRMFRISYECGIFYFNISCQCDCGAGVNH